MPKGDAGSGGQTVVNKFVQVREKPKSPYGVGNFMMISKSGLAELQERMADRTLGMQAMRVLVAMMESVGYENRVEASQKEIAVRLGMTQSEVSKASRSLLECGFVDRLQNRRGWYSISPHLAWKGSVRVLEDELSKRRRQAA